MKCFLGKWKWVGGHLAGKWVVIAAVIVARTLYHLPLSKCYDWQSIYFLFLLHTRSFGAPPLGPAVGPSGLLDFVFHAQAVWPTQRCKWLDSKLQKSKKTHRSPKTITKKSKKSKIWPTIQNFPKSQRNPKTIDRKSKKIYDCLKNIHLLYF